MDANAQEVETRPRRTFRARWILWAGLGLGVVALGAWTVDEVKTSRLQARLFSRLAGEVSFQVEPGANPDLRWPGDGPHDLRLGYHQLPTHVERLLAQQFAVTAQARQSPRLRALADRGLFVPYHEKDQAGLQLRDCRAEVIQTSPSPQRVYARFEAIPTLLVNSLLFIENRELLDTDAPLLNPAVEWVRLGKAVSEQALRLIGDDHRTPGGSTLATQIEKYRHSPDGRTDSARDKLIQMVSASLRAYLDGEQTLPRRRQIVTSYLNTVPLAARAGFGEVNGLGDALWAWYGRDFSEINQLLTQEDGPADAEPALDGTALLQRRAVAYKQALSLMVAQRRPSHYLGAHEANLNDLTDSHLRVMAEAGVIPPALRDAALAAPLQRLASPPREAVAPFTERKASTALRNRLQALLALPRAYDLDRLDLTADSSLDGALQRTVTGALRALREPEGARAAGLYGFHLLNEGDDPSKLQVSLTLFERGEHGNRLRVQTDNVDQPFDINDGARLDLGSTAKLRTLVTYLELIAELHTQWAGLDRAALGALKPADSDNLSRWARDQFVARPGLPLPDLLEAAMLRSYSADPGETFYTGGGAHTFGNFEPEDNYRVLTLREAFRRSVNLPFVRLMRDVVKHVMARSPAGTLISDPAAPLRQDYLRRFADQEGREFLAIFHRRYRELDAAEAEAALLRDVRATPNRLAAVFLMLEPQADAAALQAFVQRQLPGITLTPAAWQALRDQHAVERMNLEDRGYLAGVHPLELWLVAHLRRHPGAKLGAVNAASVAERQQVYGWIFRTRHKLAQDVRIRRLLEIEAFVAIQRRWARVGYPFDALTPSYATALGASGDRPAALAELMGIIANGGVRQPVVRLESLVFAAATPWETRLARAPQPGERVLPEAVTSTVRRALLDVVAAGTAGRLRNALTASDGTPVLIGGKTGTGDQRFDTWGPGGRLIESRVVNRSATFAFVLGERWFGTVMIYARAPYAANYKFTSALPAQLLKSLLPALKPLVDDDGCPPDVPGPGR